MNWLDYPALALRRPDLLARRLRGRSVIEIELAEIEPYLRAEPVIVEAGALDGADTERFLTRWPGATVHAFEPVPEAFAIAEERLRGLLGATLYPLALSDVTGGATMNISSDKIGGHRPDSSSLLAPSGHLVEFPDVAFGQTVEVETVTLSDWAARADVQSIDLMWLDMQGMELPTLQASPEVVARTSVVCMEVSRRELYAGSPLYADVLSWMREQGFRVAVDRTAVVMGNVLFVRD